MKPLVYLLVLLITTLSSAQSIDIQGHRGARGLLPENTIPAFIRALDEGVTTLELDVVITKDLQVVVSHEPFMSEHICSKPDGKLVEGSEAKDLNIYQMTYLEVKSYDCGSRGNERFPQQEKMKLAKPLLRDMIVEVEKYIKENNLLTVNYNVEIKSRPKGDNVYHPTVEQFSDLVQSVLSELLPVERYTIQSFDFRVLKYFNQKYRKVHLVALVYGIKGKGVKATIRKLGFVPDIYSPHYKMLSGKSVALCREKGMKVIPWTVNDLETMQKMVDMGVDGIITDYPDRAKDLKLKK